MDKTPKKGDEVVITLFGQVIDQMGDVYLVKTHNREAFLVERKSIHVNDRGR